MSFVVRASDKFSEGGSDYFARLEALQERLSGHLGQRVYEAVERCQATEAQAARAASRAWRAPVFIQVRSLAA